jgi:phosphoribosylglycinamide formyltransferase-1
MGIRVHPRPELLPREARTLGLAVLISGGGTTMANLADRILRGSLDARIQVVVSSRPGVEGIARGRDRGLETAVLARKGFVGADGAFDSDGYTKALMDLLAPRGCDLIALAGFMSRLGPEIFNRYPVVNVHPALLPRFGGAGMYGHHVHEAVLAAGETESGCSVHFVDPEYDHGPVIAQRRVPVLPDDTPDSLADRVQNAERELYPEVIGWIAAGRVRIEGNRAVVTGAP